MKSFFDVKGREWELNVNCDSLMRVQNKADMDLTLLISNPTGADKNPMEIFNQLSSPVRLCQVCYALCFDQLQKRGITPSDFGESFTGETIDNAMTALCEELVSFSPPSKRAYLNRLIAVSRGILTKFIDLMEEEILASEKAFENAVHGTTSGSSPE